MERTKVIAMHLPQYHEIPENNKWWGKGFTEWTNVKKAKPLYEGHLQPRAPLNDDYYDLSVPSALINQMNLAKKYGVDGFCFYHYWFNGRKLLEKPIEMLLDNPNVPIEYCLCWANEPWTRTWDGDKGAKEILINQYYGEENEWIKHFDYIELFFNQEKYLKVNGKPVFIIYNSADIHKQKEMIMLWKKMAIDKGYRGIFLINVHRQNSHNEIPRYGDGVMDFEPFATISNLMASDYKRLRRPCLELLHKNEDSNCYIWDYQAFCEIMTSKYTFANKHHYLGLFAGWDNTPRRGLQTELIFEGNTPVSFKGYFKKQYERSIALNNELMFINAWNEWAEGTFLEPCQRYKYGYLEAIRDVKTEVMEQYIDEKRVVGQ